MNPTSATQTDSSQNAASGAQRTGDSTIIRCPAVEDGAAIWKLVRDSGTLELNSCYSYLLLCRDFSATCRVAVDSQQMLGFVTAYIPPARPNAVFVWQIGVAAAARRTGLGRRILLELLSGDACRNVDFLEATVTPSNTASQRLFESLARQFGTECRSEPCFRGDDFGEQGHEGEDLFRVGPLRTPITRDR